MQSIPDSSDEKLISLILKKDLQMHKLEEIVEPEAAARVRRKVIEKLTCADLSALAEAPMHYQMLIGKNAENVVGFVNMPVGIAGPIKVNGKHAHGDFYVPLATTEGALIAGINRGMKAITSSGGARVRVIGDAMARAPLFEFDSVTDAEEFLEWVDKNRNGIGSAIENTTSHGKLDSITSFVTGNNVWLRIAMKTGDAMGMNMVTIAAEAAAEYIESNFPKARLITVSGNMCSDKKESMVNNLLGRGKTVIAEALISNDIIDSILHSTAEAINLTNIKKNLLGNARAGSTKFSGHSANMVAAVFAATGQDIAQVVESSNCYTWTEVRPSGLYISVTMPSLEIGTIGGGTVLPPQKAALSMMGVAGGGKIPGSNSSKLAEIIASLVLAGELNLVAAQGNRELGKTHKKLGRAAK